jgi:hypothetical protein
MRRMRLARSAAAEAVELVELVIGCESWLDAVFGKHGAGVLSLIG